MNEEAGETIPQRVFNGFVRILRGALAGTADYFLVLEDDNTIARHFRAAVLAWSLESPPFSLPCFAGFFHSLTREACASLPT